jgi:hypothetical protein
VSARDWFAPGQVWRPRRGRRGPRLIVVNVHRVDRLVEVIDARAADRLTAKRTLIRFGDIRASHRLEHGEPGKHGGQDQPEQVGSADSEPPRRTR